MIDLENSSFQGCAIAALFDARASAAAAAADLLAAGIAPSRVSIAGAEQLPEESARTRQEKGFWKALKDFFMPDEDRHIYAEALRRGFYMVSVQPLEHEYQRALDILDREGAIDIEEREAFSRADGWTGYALDESEAAEAAPLSPTGAASVAAAATGSSRPAAASAHDDTLALARRDAGLSRP